MVGYGVEEYDPGASDQKAEKAKFTSSASGRAYDHRILIYDSNDVVDGTAQLDTDHCLLYDKESAEWEVPAYYWDGVTSDELSVQELLDHHQGTSKDAKQRRKRIVEAAKEITGEDDEEKVKGESCRFGSLTSCQNETGILDPDASGSDSEAKRCMLAFDRVKNTVEWNGGSVTGSSAGVSSSDALTSWFYESKADEGAGDLGVTVVLPGEYGRYEVTPADGGDGQVDVAIVQSGYFHDVSCTAASGVTINADGGYEVDDNAGDVKVETTLGDGRSYKVEADGGNSGDFRVTPKGDRVTVEGDDVAGVKVTVETDGGEKTYTVPEGRKSYTTGEGTGARPRGRELYRLFDPSTGEHLYTGDSYEVSVLVKRGWDWERAQTMTVPASGTPVWRLFDPKNGDHHYTSDAYECKVLTTQKGWVYDFGGKPAFYGAPASGRPVYRIYDTRAARFGHLFTADANERRVHLSEGGWDDEGIAWRVL